MAQSLNTVLVLGGSGALGSHIVNQLLDEGHATEVYVFDVKLDSVLRHSNAEYIQGDITKLEDVTAAIKRINPKVIFHTVSPKLMGYANPKLFDLVNVQGTENVLSAISGGTKRTLIYTSSSSVIHNNLTDLDRVTEDLPYCFEPEQIEHYTHTKAKAEVLVREANGKNDLLTVVLRGCMLFGEGDVTFTPPMVSSAKAGRGKFQVGDGKNEVDVCYVGNAANAHILAAQALLREAAQDLDSIPDDMRVNGEAFVITNDEPWPFWDLSRVVGASAGYPVRKEDVWIIPASVYYVMMVGLEWFTWIFSLGQKQSNMNRRMVRYLTMTRTFDITKAKKRLGYRPLVSVQEGIDRSTAWYLEQSKLNIAK